MTIIEVHILRLDKNPHYALFLDARSAARVPPNRTHKAGSIRRYPKHQRSFPSNIMATRRNVSDEKAELVKDGKNDFKPVAGEKSNIAPAVPASVILLVTLYQRQSHELGFC